MKTIAFFNTMGGVGKTSLVYHLGWSLADRSMRVLLVDLDPQSNLTAMCVDEERMEALWVDDDMTRQSIRGAVQPIVEGAGDIQGAHLEALSDRLVILPGDIRLSELEQNLSDAWPRCLDRDPAAFRVVSSFHRLIQKSAQDHEADVVLVDVGPNLGAINRSAMIAADFVVTPVEAEMFSIQGLKNVGPALRRWREEWKERLVRNPVKDLALPGGSLSLAGYVIMQMPLYRGQVSRAYERWLHEIPSVYEKLVLQRATEHEVALDADPNCLAVLRHYFGLMPMAQAAHKPIFKLTPADGAIGAHAPAVHDVARTFTALSEKLLDRISRSA